MVIGEENLLLTSPSFMHAISKSSLVAGAVFVSVVSLRAGDWPQWRGENRDGHATGAATLSSLPKDSKPVWKLPIGPGFSAPVVAGGKLVYLDEQDGKEVAHCLNANTGKFLWNETFAESAGDEWGSGPRSTPFIDGDRVFVQSMGGEFRCLNLADGKARWGVSFQKYGIGFSTKAADGTAFAPSPVYVRHLINEGAKIHDPRSHA